MDQSYEAAARQTEQEERIDLTGVRVLLVEDNDLNMECARFTLEQVGMEVTSAWNGQEAVDAFAQSDPGQFDLILMDVMMPELDGIRATAKLREGSNVPIILLTAKSEDSDKLMGFACGADDYVTKPFNILELKARVRALLRRTAAAAAKQQEAGDLTVGHIRLDPAERSAWKDGAQVELTAKEFDLMELLMRNPGRVYSRENLLNVVWGYEYVGDYRTVDVHIRRLREKLELDPANPEYIRTKWGVGYYLSSQKNS